MKKLKDLLNESKKVYSFKIGIAGDLPNNIDTSLKSILEKFAVDSFAKKSKTPTQSKPLDFPALENVEVQYWEVNLKYPTIDPVLREYISQQLSINEQRIVVRNPESPLELEQETDNKKEYEPLLTQEHMGGTSAQEAVGTNRVMDLLKELDAARKEANYPREYNVEFPKEEASQTKSAIGN